HLVRQPTDIESRASARVVRCLRTFKKTTLITTICCRRRCKAPAKSERLRGSGEGGIRTLGSLLGYGALAKRCFRPLSHLTKCRAGISPGIADCQLSIAN